MALPSRIVRGLPVNFSMIPSVATQLTTVITVIKRARNPKKYTAPIRAGIRAATTEYMMTGIVVLSLRWGLLLTVNIRAIVPGIS